MNPEARLRLYQLLSPALPVGAFSYAEGLEPLVQRGVLPDAAAVAAWLAAELQAGSLRLEAAALPQLKRLLLQWQRQTQAGREAEAEDLRRQLLQRDSALLALREAREVRAQQRQMGGSLLQLLADLGWPLPTAVAEPTAGASPTPVALAWPCAFAWAGCCLEIPELELIEAYLYGWSANQLSAAVRLVPLGPTEAQRQQLALGPLISRQAELLLASDPDDLWSAGVGAGMAQLQHAELYSRLFRS